MDRLSPNATTRVLVTRLWRDWMRAHLGQLALAVLLTVAVAATTGVVPLLIERAVDLIEQGDRQHFPPIVAAIVVVALLRGFASYAQSVVSQSAALRIINRLQKAMFAHLMRADIASFQATAAGNLLSRFTNDVNMMRDTLSKSLVGLLKNALTAAALVAAMFYQDWLLALLVVVLFPFGSIPIVRIGRRLRRASANAQQEVGEMTAKLGQAIAGIQMVKSYRLEAHEQARADGLFESVYRLVMKMVKGRARTYPFLGILGGISVSVILAFGGWRVISGSGTLGEFVAFVTALTVAFQQIRPMGGLYASVQEGLSAVHRSFDLLDTQPAIVDRPAARILEDCQGAIAFDQVAFSYDDGAPRALHDISFSVAPGQRVALVGPSGAGKSSILNLIPRFYDPQQGAVSIDGTDVRDFTLASLRAHIALVSQEETLFDDTVAANIGFGRPGAAREDIVAAAQAAAAHDFISELPDGYDTVVGERGSSLSGGERQRIAIARAMLRDAPILLLDEATSALDAESERQVQQALGRLAHGRTTLVIAHRLATVRSADIIYVMDAGRIVEAGTHSELSARGGLYARLSKLQLRDDPAAAAPPQDLPTTAPAPA